MIEKRIFPNKKPNDEVKKLRTKVKVIGDYKYLREHR